MAVTTASLSDLYRTTGKCPGAECWVAIRKYVAPELIWDPDDKRAHLRPLIKPDTPENKEFTLQEAKLYLDLLDLEQKIGGWNPDYYPLHPPMSEVVRNQVFNHLGPNRYYLTFPQMFLYEKVGLRTLGEQTQAGMDFKGFIPKQIRFLRDVTNPFVQRVIAICTRGGAKTYLSAAGNFICCVWIPRYKVTILGGSEEQAKTAYSFVSGSEEYPGFIESEHLKAAMPMFEKVKASRGRSGGKTSFPTRSVLRFIPASLRATKSWRTDSICLEEFALIHPDLYKGIKGQQTTSTVSKICATTTPDNPNHPAKDIWDTADEAGWRRHSWTLFEAPWINVPAILDNEGYYDADADLRTIGYDKPLLHCDLSTPNLTPFQKVADFFIPKELDWNYFLRERFGDWAPAGNAVFNTRTLQRWCYKPYDWKERTFNHDPRSNLTVDGLPPYRRIHRWSLGIDVGTSHFTVGALMGGRKFVRTLSTKFGNTKDLDWWDVFVYGVVAKQDWAYEDVIPEILDMTKGINATINVRYENKDPQFVKILRKITPLYPNINLIPSNFQNQKIKFITNMKEIIHSTYWHVPMDEVGAREKPFSLFRSQYNNYHYKVVNGLQTEEPEKIADDCVDAGMHGAMEFNPYTGAEYSMTFLKEAKPDKNIANFQNKAWSLLRAQYFND